MTFLSLWNWLKPLYRRPARCRRRHRRHDRTLRAQFVPRLEGLEDRTVPSTLTVTSAADNGSAGTLRAVIAAAQSGDSINFDTSLAGQTIALTSGELAISKSLNIQGLGADKLTISGNNASRVFDISGSTTHVEIDDLTIADGLANTPTATGPFGNVTMGGGLLNNGANVTLAGVTFADNQAIGSQNGYVQTNLVSNIPSLAQITDPNLQNPWGISESADGPFWVSDQKTNEATLYSVTAAGVSKVPLTVAIPTTAAGPQGPTGQVNNDTSSFLVNGAPASFIFADLNGTISAWNPSAGTTAQVEVNTNGAATYTGLVTESTTAGDFLYAANVKQGRIDVSDGSFQPVNLGANAFKVPTGQLPSGLVPFNVEDVNGDLYVAYAPAGPPEARNSAPLGSGAVVVFDTSGNFIKVLTSGGNLASPWGLTLAPSTFGQFGGDLLVGNFSYQAGEINAFDPVTGAYLGTLSDSSGTTLLKGAEGIWDMSFGNGVNGGLPGTLYFATGLNAELDGLFGAIDPIPGIAEGGAVANIAGGTLTLAHDQIADNQALGAAGGNAQGGGVFTQGSTLTVEHSTFRDNRAIGGVGAAGGGGQGGALAVLSGTASIRDTTITGNEANGGDGSAGANGGNGFGGGVWVGGGNVTVSGSRLTHNRADGGSSGDGGADGLGVGGGFYNAGGIAMAARTKIKHNHASTSNDDVFGSLG